MRCAEPRFNSLLTRNVMAICSHLATTLVPHRTQFLLLAALLIPTIVCAADFTAPVVSVLDGDTLEVLHNRHPERIRLRGIDCPEKGQAYGNNAKHAASELVYGKEVRLQTYGKEKYGRLTTRPSACWGRCRFPSTCPAHPRARRRPRHRSGRPHVWRSGTSGRDKALGRLKGWRTRWRTKKPTCAK